ncbi:MAG: chorismate synthase [Candidatus Omnitrophota bacterium]
MLRYLTAGESHGKALIAILEGMASGLKIDEKIINKELSRRQIGYGRGGRMKIETDKVEIVSGVRKGVTLGSPIAMLIKNKDFKIDLLGEVRCPRPGHADLAGAIKYGTDDARNILERASARETAARTAVGALCKILLAECGIEVFSYTKSIGCVDADVLKLSYEKIRSACLKSDLNCPDKNAENLMKKEIDKAKAAGDTLGGTFEVIAVNLPIGLGSCMHYDRKLDARLAAELCSIQAIKGVEFGAGFEGCKLFGSQFHDAITLKGKKIARKTNNAGGIEGGMSNGEDIVLRCAMKPIATLLNPIDSVDMRTKSMKKADVERSDICAVAAAGIVAENVTAFVLAQAVLEKYGSDSMTELLRHF